MQMGKNIDVFVRGALLPMAHFLGQGTEVVPACMMAPTLLVMLDEI